MDLWQKTVNFIVKESPFSAEQNGEVRFAQDTLYTRYMALNTCVCVKATIVAFRKNVCIKIITIDLKGLRINEGTNNYQEAII